MSVGPEPVAAAWHDGIYDLQGKNIGGPPPRPLPPFEVHLEPRGPGQPQRIVIVKT